MTYEDSAYFPKVWGRPQNSGNHRGGSEMLGAVVRIPLVWAASRPGDRNLCTPVRERMCVTDGSGGHIAI
jgi:hypothetical protein